jgi:hypothetical protein
MLTGPKLRSQVDALWDKFWTGDLFTVTTILTRPRTHGKH